MRWFRALWSGCSETFAVGSGIRGPRRARPLFHSALILTVVAIPPAFRSPVTMGLVAVSFLLTVKSLPGAGWIYPALAAIGAALYFPWLSRLSLVELITACLVLAYVLWMFGLLVRRGKSLLADRLGLRPLDYELPLFNLAAVVGLVAFLLKFDGGLEHGTQWTARAWVPLVLSPLALGMIRARPRREFVHVSLVFLIWGVISLVAPSLSDPHFLTLALVVCSLGLQVTDLAIRPGEQVLCDRLAIHGVSLGTILHGWWFGLGLFGIVLGSSVVMAGMAGALAHLPELRLTTSTIDWWAITASIVLVGTQIVLAGLDSDLLEAMRPEGLIVGVELTGVALLWWLGVAGSPLGIWDMQPGHYYPLATALAGLVIAERNSRLGQRENLAEPAEQGPTPGQYVPAVVASPRSFAAGAGLHLRSGEYDHCGHIRPRGNGFWALGRSAGAGVGRLPGGAGLVGGGPGGWAGGRPPLDLDRNRAAPDECRTRRDRRGFHARGTGRLVQTKGSQPGAQEATIDLQLECHPAAFGIGSRTGCIRRLAGRGRAGRPGRSRPAILAGGMAFASIGTLLALSLFYLLLTARWNAEWLVYLARRVWSGLTSIIVWSIP